MADSALKPGRVSDFNNSMAEEMEQAFREEWQAVMSTTLLEAGTKERKVLFSAIARGVVKHLKENAAALKVTVNVTQTDEVLMRSNNLNAISVLGFGVIAPGQADVTQINETNNLIESEGAGIISEVTVDD